MKTCKNCNTERHVFEGVGCDSLCGIVDERMPILWTPIDKKCAYEDQEQREIAIATAEFKHVKHAEAPICKICGMFMTAKVKQGGIEWHCGGVLNGCYYTEWEFTG